MWCERVPVAVDLHEIVLAPTLGSTLGSTLGHTYLALSSAECVDPHEIGHGRLSILLFPITVFLILIFRLFIFHIFNKVDCRSTWKSLANTADPLSSLPFQLITFSTLLSEIKGHHRLPTFQQISLFGWTEQITNHKSPTNRQNAELRLDAISLLVI